MRELGQLSAAKTLATALPYIREITGLGLASTELGNPPENYKDVYRTGTLLGLHKVAHAGVWWSCGFWVTMPGMCKGGVGRVGLCVSAVHVRCAALSQMASARGEVVDVRTHKHAIH